MRKDKTPKQKAADLMRSSNANKLAAYEQEKIGKAQIKNNVKPNTMVYQGNVLPVGQERIDIAKGMRTQATKDSLQSVRITAKIAASKPKAVAKKVNTQKKK